MLLYARIFVLCASLARIQKLQPGSSNFESERIDQNVMSLWQSLVATIMDQLAFLIGEPAYRCQFPWAPTYPALTVAFVSKLMHHIALIVSMRLLTCTSYLCTSNRSLAS
jgi:hypothetical protein